LRDGIAPDSRFGRIFYLNPLHNSPENALSSRVMVRFENVGMRYGAGPEVLRDVTFVLEAGSFNFLTGLSGAGKTTLLKLINIIEPPSRGLITLFGHHLAATKRGAFPALRRRIGFVFQDFRLLDHLSAFDNVALPLRIAGRRESDYRHDVEELLAWVGLGDRLRSKPPTLSGGEQQRVAIARAVVAKPDLLIADEPTGNVDSEIGARLIRLFGELNRLGTTVLIATHDRTLVETTRAREMRLVDGRLVELRTPRP
jgi:cell division transport system ATP-binding protein